jgi:hypothetical protein
MSQLSQDEAIRGCGPGGLLLTFLEQGQLLRRNVLHQTFELFVEITSKAAPMAPLRFKFRLDRSSALIDDLTGCRLLRTFFFDRLFGASRL